MSSGHAGPSTPSSTVSPPVTPLISERFIDIPSQRLYALSFALLIQVGVPFVNNCFDSLVYHPFEGHQTLRFSPIPSFLGGQPHPALWQKVAAG